MVLKLKTSFSQLDSMKSLVLVGIYWRGVAHKPSPHLISKLRSYEARHKRCGPHTTSYNQTLLLVQSDTPLDLDCKYIMWVSLEGLGNKMLSLASTFLYALLTDRVLRHSSSLLRPLSTSPTDFPFTDHFTTFNHQSNQTYGNHDRKALAEIYLLSLMDEEKLVTSGWSTFGYVAQALAGVKPWILYRPQNETVPDPACGRGVSLEPCYHTPPHVDCETGRGGVDLSGVVPHVMPCEDFSWGLKLF